MDFAKLIGPIAVERFMTEYYGKRPLHIPAAPGVDRHKLISWERLNSLLEILPHWTESNLKLIINSRPINPEFYMETTDPSDAAVRRASSAKIDVFLAMGASMVANSVHEISPEIRQVTDALGNRFSARTGANAYCSFRDVQAFNSHCDLHEVFAVHCEGEKTWRIYENRAVAPVEQLLDNDAQHIIDAVKGRVLLEARMRPGDLLYIPRGYYHDALASSEASLHVTFSVTPYNGRVLFRLLEDAAMSDPDFRAYLPDARNDGGVQLSKHIELLATKIANTMKRPSFIDELVDRQRALWQPHYAFTLPSRLELQTYAATDHTGRIVNDEDGAFLVTSRVKLPISGHLAAVEWALTRPAFSAQELFARYPHVPQEELRNLIATLEKASLFRPYDKSP